MRPWVSPAYILNNHGFHLVMHLCLLCGNHRKYRWAF